MKLFEDVPLLFNNNENNVVFGNIYLKRILSKKQSQNKAFINNVRTSCSAFLACRSRQASIVWKGISGLKFPCFLFMQANGTGPFEFRAVPIL